MGLNVGELSATLSLDDDKFQRGMDHADKNTSRLGETASKAGVVIAGAMVTAGVAAVGFGTKAVMAASDLSESMSKANNVFKGSASDIQSWAKTSASAFGQSRQQALEAVSTFGNLFVQLGSTSDASANMSKQMVQLASDFASFHNASPEEAITAMTAAFRGEYDAVQRFVPTINAAAVEQEALTMTHKKSAAELTNLEKAMATQQLMVKGAGDATGDFARTQDGLANRMRVAKAKLEDFSASVGEKLMPIVLGAFDLFEKWGPKVQSAMEDGLKAIKPFTDALAEPFKNPGNYDLKTLLNAGTVEEDMNGAQAAIVGLGNVFSALQTAAQPLVDLFNQIRATVTQWVSENQATISQWQTTISEIFTLVIEVLTLAWEAITNVFSFAVGFISDLWTRFGQHLLDNISAAITAVLNIIQGVLEVIKGVFNLFIGVFTGDWSRAWDGIKQIFGGVWQAIGGIIDLALTIIKNAIGLAMAFISTVWSTVWGAVKSVAADAWNGIKSIVSSGLNALVDFVKSLGQRITSAADGAWDGMVNGFKKAINYVIGKWNSISFTTPKVHIPGTDTDVGGDKISVPQVPLLAKGGIITGAGMAIVGERGPELVALPRAASVIPLTGTHVGGSTTLHIDTISINGVSDGDSVMAALPELQAALIAGVRRAG